VIDRVSVAIVLAGIDPVAGIAQASAATTDPEVVLDRALAEATDPEMEIAPEDLEVDDLEGVIDQDALAAVTGLAGPGMVIDRSWTGQVDDLRMRVALAAPAMANGITVPYGGIDPVGITPAGTIRIGVGAAAVGPGTGTTTVFVRTTAGTTAAGTTIGAATGTRLWHGARSVGG